MCHRSTIKILVFYIPHYTCTAVAACAAEIYLPHVAVLPISDTRLGTGDSVGYTWKCGSLSSVFTHPHEDNYHFFLKATSNLLDKYAWHIVCLHIHQLLDFVYISPSLVLSSSSRRRVLPSAVFWTSRGRTCPPFSPRYKHVFTFIA